MYKIFLFKDVFVYNKFSLNVDYYLLHLFDLQFVTIYIMSDKESNSIIIRHVSLVVLTDRPLLY
jgi:hypothetical protein